jgi:hypothetical protein
MNGLTTVTRGAVSGTKVSALPALKSLKQMADEIGVDEYDLSRITIYSGIRRRGGLYDEPEFLRMYIRYLHEKLFGFAATNGMAKNGTAPLRPGALLQR